MEQDDCVYDFGLRLKTLREKKSLTQSQVGNYLGVTGMSVSGYENNTTNPPADIIRKLALLFGVTSDFLLGLERRKTLVIDGLTPVQEKAMEQIFETMQNVFKTQMPTPE